MTAKNKLITKEKLYQLIIIENKKCKDVAKLFQCSSSNISKWLKIYEISKNTRNINKTFGFLTLLEEKGEDRYGHKIWECECVCGNLVKRTFSNLSSRGEKNSCGCRRLRASYKHHLFKGFGEISSTYWNGIISSAKDRNIEFNINIEYAWNLFLTQNRICVFSGEILNFASNSKTNDRTASLDRIDSTKGYIEGNLQWIHKDLQNMKGAMKDQLFIQWCDKIIKYRNQNV